MYASLTPISSPVGLVLLLKGTVKYPAAELRGIQFSKKLSSPLSKIPLNYGGDGGGFTLLDRESMVYHS
jgi:hypothetical protein